MNKIIGSLALLIMLVFGLVGVSQAGDLPWNSKEECLAGFDIRKVDLNSPDWQGSNDLLTGYTGCRAILNKNIADCNALINDGARAICKREFKKYTFFVNLVNNRATESECLEGTKMGNKCRGFVQAFKASNTSICEGNKKCIDVIKLASGPDVAPDASVTITTMKAVRDSQVSLCDSIIDSESTSFKENCRALASGNINICTECSGFVNFKNNYCEWLGRKIELKKAGSISKEGKAYEKK